MRGLYYAIKNATVKIGATLVSLLAGMTLVLSTSLALASGENRMLHEKPKVEIEKVEMEKVEKNKVEKEKLEKLEEKLDELNKDMLDIEDILDLEDEDHI